MSDGRTIWRARDARWYSREWIVVLGEDFGAAGPSVIAWLEDEAKLQNDGGRVKTGPRAISRGCFVDVVTVGHVVSRSVTLGLLVDYEQREGRFTCRVSWFTADQGRAQAANRKARQRDGGPVEPDDPSPLSRSVTESHGESRSVTKCPPTGQDRTGQGKDSSSDASGADQKGTEDDVRLCRLLGEMAKERNAKFKVKSRGRWLADMRLLRDRDGNSPEEIERVIRWVFADQFWGGVVQSPGSLREHFAAIWDRMNRGSNVVPLRGRASASELLQKIKAAEESA